MKKTNILIFLLAVLFLLAGCSITETPTPKGDIVKTRGEIFFIGNSSIRFREVFIKSPYPKTYARDTYVNWEKADTNQVYPKGTFFKVKLLGGNYNIFCDGKFLLPSTYQSIETSGDYWKTIENKVGIMYTKEGKEVFRGKGHMYEEIGTGIAVFEEIPYKKTFLSNGKTTVGPFSYIIFNPSDPSINYFLEKGSGILSRNLEKIIEGPWEGVHFAGKELFIAENYSKRESGYVDKNGKIVVPIIRRINLGTPHEDAIIFEELNGASGWYDLLGNRHNSKYTIVEPFKNGKAIAKKGKLHGVIDKEDKIIHLFNIKDYEFFLDKTLPLYALLEGEEEWTEIHF